MRRKALPLALLALFSLSLFSCDEGTPVAPEGTILRISANPTRIAKTGTSNVTLQALRSNGNPVNPGTEIRLSTNIGQIEPVVYTDTDGVAHATLKGDGRVGVATISAYSGGVEPVETEIEVGSRAGAISVSADPTSLGLEGGVVELIALVRDDEGQPLPGASVNFRTEAGSLRSGGAFLTTDADGEVRDRLTISAEDAQSEPDRIITVTAESGGASGVVSDTVEITIQTPPQASFTFTISNNIVSFTDTSSGNPTQWRWNFGDGASSTEKNPVHMYTVAGSYVVRLTATNAFGSGEASATVGITTIP
jgi:hypothetical protein